MIGRFTVRRPNNAEPGWSPEQPAAVSEDISHTVFAEPVPEPVVPAPNSLLSDKLLDAKVRLHRRLIEEINLQALEKLPEDEIRAHVMQLVTQYILVERLPLNTQELNAFVSEILDEMTGLGPLEPLLKDRKSVV
jgi:pilus assembly protein CpaF